MRPPAPLLAAALLVAWTCGTCAPSEDGRLEVTLREDPAAPLPDPRPPCAIQGRLHLRAACGSDGGCDLVRAACWPPGEALRFTAAAPAGVYTGAAEAASALDCPRGPAWVPLASADAGEVHVGSEGTTLEVTLSAVRSGCPR